MMFDEDPQANPVEPNSRLQEFRERVASTVTVLEENKKAVAVWFFKGLLAFNLLLGSVIFWTVIVPRLVDSF